jgi:two-component system chemotaxis sensor kinase CheA
MALSPQSGIRVTRSVLVVDDVDATRHGLAELLRLRGYAPREAKNGAEGIEVLREHPDTCVVVLDLTMPGTNGVWFREQQLMEPALAHIPVIVFTGSASAEELRRLAVTDVLMKPFSVDELFAAIERHGAAV